MADMETERANGIFAGVSNLSKGVQWIFSLSAGGAADILSQSGLWEFDTFV